MGADFSLGTVLASAVISVFVSSVVSLLLVPVIAVRQARAQHREEARRRLAEAVAPMLLDLQRYEARQAGGRERDRGVGEDAETAATVLRAAGGLGPIRSRLVMRRCRIIFGYWLAQATLYPGEDEGNQRFAGLLFGAVRDRGQDVDMTSHVLHQAYATPPGGGRSGCWHTTCASSPAPADLTVSLFWPTGRREQRLQQ